MSNSVHSFSSSSESLAATEGNKLKGILYKWTNYYYGWQERFVCCEDGSLNYYISENDTTLGCRGSICLSKAKLTVSEYDSCRFEVTINDSTWYLRSIDANERQNWIDIIKANMLDREVVSIQCENSLQTTFNDEEMEFRGKVSEFRSLRAILSNQVDILQRYFDACMTFANQHRFHDWLKQRESGSPVDADAISFFYNSDKESFQLSKTDLKREVLSFKVTTAGVETSLNDFLTMVKIREEMWSQKCQGLERRIQFYENKYSNDDESDDEFYDPNNNFDEKMFGKHQYTDEIEQKIKEHLDYSLNMPGSSDDAWELLAQDQDMKLYRKQLIQDGVVCDPIKALHRAKGVTARELCYYFWETEYRTKWDQSIEELHTLEVINDKTIIVHQIHKQLWPITQRDCIYISTMLKIENLPFEEKDLTPHDTWMICNFSVDHDKAPLPPGRVRALVEVALVCQTFINPSTTTDEMIARDQLHCEIAYIAKVNPGGWAPVSVVRTIMKREYPKFLRNFTTFVENKMKDSVVTF